VVIDTAAALGLPRPAVPARRAVGRTARPRRRVVAADVPGARRGPVRVSRSGLAALAPPSTTAARRARHRDGGQPADRDASSPTTASSRSSGPGWRWRPRADGRSPPPRPRPPHGRAGQTVQSGFRVPRRARRRSCRPRRSPRPPIPLALRLPQKAASTATAITGTPVSAPYRTYSSGHRRGRRTYAQSGDQLGVSGAGRRPVQQRRRVQPRSTGRARSARPPPCDPAGVPAEHVGYSKAGIIVRNDMTASGSGPRRGDPVHHALRRHPVRVNGNGGTHIASVMPPNGGIADQVRYGCGWSATGSL